MMRYYIVSDVHGFYNELMFSLDKNGFDSENDCLVVLGDLLDRGKQPMECLNFVNGLKNKILVRGNHEDLMCDMLNRGEVLSHDVHNGTYETVINLVREDGMRSIDELFCKMKNLEQWNRYLESTVDFFEIGNCIFVHGWIPCESSDTKMYLTDGAKYTFDENWRHGNWVKARWTNGMDAWNKGIKVDGKTIYCGHWNCSYGWSNIRQAKKEFPQKNRIGWEKSFEPFIDNGIVAIDSCVQYTGFINCIVLEENQLWQ